MLYNKNWGLNEVGQVLIKAADLLEEHGHTKHARERANGSMCFLGALEKAQGDGDPKILYRPDSPLTYAASEAISRMLGLDTGRYGGDHRCACVDWNNDDDRTGQEVIDAMRLAAKTQKVSA